MSITTQTTLEVSADGEEPDGDEKVCSRCGKMVSKYRYPVDLGDCDADWGESGA